MGRVLLFCLSVVLMFGSDYFDKFMVCDVEFGSKMTSCFNLFSDIEELKKINLEDEDAKELIGNYFYIESDNKKSFIKKNILNVKKLYEYCVKNKPEGKYMLCFFSHLFIKKDNTRWVKNEYYINDKFDDYTGSFYIIPEGVLDVDKLSVFFARSYANGICYKVEKYEDEAIVDSGILDVKIINYNEYEKRKKIFDLTSRIKTAKEVNDTDSIKKYENELKKLKDGINIKDDGCGMKGAAHKGNSFKGSPSVDTEALPRLRKKRTGAPTKGPVTNAPGKKNNNSPGSSSDKNGNKSSSRKCCC